MADGINDDSHTNKFLRLLATGTRRREAEMFWVQARSMHSPQNETQAALLNKVSEQLNTLIETMRASPAPKPGRAEQRRNGGRGGLGKDA